MNEVMEEEIDICNKEFLRLYGKAIDIESIS